MTQWQKNWFRKLIISKLRKRNRVDEDKIVIQIWEVAGRPALLIDDARCFDGKGDYPTIEALKAYITDKGEISSFRVQDVSLG